MAIYGYAGKPGSGKSYSVVANVVIPGLEAGRTVYHNMILNEGRLMAMTGGRGRLVPFDAESTPDQLVANAPPGALVIIDESLRYWPAGTRANKVPPHQLEFFTKHRHYVGDDGRSTDIVLVAQDFGSQCAAFIRDLIEYTYRCVSLRAIGTGKRFRREIYDGVVKGDKPPASKLLRKELIKFDPKIFACYQSHTASAKGVAGEELHDKTVTVWKDWRVTAAGVALVAAVFLITLAIHSLRSFSTQHLDGEGVSDPARIEHREIARDAAAPPRPVPMAPVRPPESKTLRLSGEIVINGRRRYVADSEHSHRFIHPADCSIDRAGNRTCTVDGQLVATWTGLAAPLLNQWFSGAASSTNTDTFTP